MVNIGNTNWLSLGGAKVGQVQSGNGNVHFGGGNSNQGSSTLQDRLSAIDRGDPAAFLSMTGNSRVSSIGGVSAPQGDSLLARLDAIGTGELSPHYGTNEKKLDWSM